MDDLPSRANLISKLRIESLRITENIKSEFSANLASKNGICGNKVSGKICRGKHRPENCWMKYPEKAPICEICTGNISQIIIRNFLIQLLLTILFVFRYLKIVSLKILQILGFLILVLLIISAMILI